MDCFAVLGLRPGATHAEVKAAFRARAKVLHPDQGGDAEQFRRLQAAYTDAIAQAGRVADAANRFAPPGSTGSAAACVHARGAADGFEVGSGVRTAVEDPAAGGGDDRSFGACAGGAGGTVEACDAGGGVRRVGGVCRCRGWCWPAVVDGGWRCGCCCGVLAVLNQTRRNVTKRHSKA
jgi:hypothetical protein